MRRDPSDVIKAGDLYYVWYSKGKISPGYDATVWYATSPNGHEWTEKGMALAKGEARQLGRGQRVHSQYSRSRGALLALLYGDFQAL